jgi:protein ImuB
MQRRLLSLWFPELPSLPSGGAPADLQSLALWCQCYSPLTSISPPDGIFIDITGCAHLFGGEAEMARRILRRFPSARVAVANTAAASWGLARYGDGKGENLDPLPLAALNLADRTIIKLRRVGIRRIGELRRLPRAELTAGYGPEPALKLAQALGTAPEVLRFFSPPPDFCETRHFAEPIFAPAQLQAALAVLAARLCARLAAAQAGAATLRAGFYRVDAQRPEILLRFAGPCRDESQISKLLNEKLQNIDPGFGVEAISLDAVTTEPSAPVQISMEKQAPDYTKPINTILNRVGGARIWRVAPRDSHIPEFSARRIPVTLPPVPWGKPGHKRPVKLLRRPDAITAIAPVPDDPPVFFSWRGKSHRITRATGPERIARDWWRHEHDNARPEEEKIRDYYAVEDTEGSRFWVFRAGRVDGQAPARWYIHGFFG